MSSSMTVKDLYRHFHANLLSPIVGEPLEGHGKKGCHSDVTLDGGYTWVDTIRHSMSVFDFYGSASAKLCELQFSNDVSPFTAVVRVLQGVTQWISRCVPRLLGTNISHCLSAIVLPALQCAAFGIRHMQCIAIYTAIYI